MSLFKWLGAFHAKNLHMLILINIVVVIFSCYDTSNSNFRGFCCSVGSFRVISHYQAALYTARRDEMCSIVEVTFRYLADRPQVHSEISGLPFMVKT